MKHTTKTTNGIPRIGLVFMLCVSSALSGCVGYDRLGFVTNTNVGVNVSSLPQPTAELDIARGEFLISPTFEDGQTLPVASSFSREGNFFFNDIEAVFSGGPASLAVAQPTFKTGHNSIICLREPPPISRWHKTLHWLGLREEGQPRVSPLLFGTNTTSGLKLQWSGATAILPDTLRIGYHRDEVALAPIIGRKIGDTDSEGCWGKGRELLRNELMDWNDDERKISEAADSVGIKIEAPSPISPSQPYKLGAKHTLIHGCHRYGLELEHGLRQQTGT